jgi:serine/threonine-protein kinase
MSDEPTRPSDERPDRAHEANEGSSPGVESSGGGDSRTPGKYSVDDFPPLAENPNREAVGPQRATQQTKEDTVDEPGPGPEPEAAPEPQPASEPETRIEASTPAEVPAGRKVDTQLETQTRVTRATFDPDPAQADAGESMIDISRFIQAELCQAPGDASLRRGVIATVGDGRYEIKSRLDAGGMGTVFLAYDVRGGCEVAIKIISPSRSGDVRQRERFLEEARQMYGLPSTVPVLVVKDLGDVDEPYYVMEAMTAGSLGKLIARHGAMDAVRAAQVALDVAVAVQFLHEKRGRMHRDVKPDNILLAEDGTARLGDFGLIRNVGEGTRGLRSGTLPYMPPEVCGREKKNVGFEWDIYAIGAVIYEMLTGRPPYADLLDQASNESWSDDQLFEAVTTTALQPIAELNPDADPRLIAIAESAMATELRDRYAEIRDLVNDLALVNQGVEAMGPRRARVEPAPAAPHAAQVRPHRRFRRWVALVVVAVAIGGALLAWIANQSPKTGIALLDAKNPNATWQVTVSTDSGETDFKVRERFLLGITPDKTCFLTVLMFDCEGTSLIDPKRGYRLRERIKRELSAGGAGFEAVRCPDGSSDCVLVKVIATYEALDVWLPAHEVDADYPVLDPNNAKVRLAESDGGEYTDDLSSLFEDHEWATAELYLCVEE